MNHRFRRSFCNFVAITFANSGPRLPGTNKNKPGKRRAPEALATYLVQTCNQSFDIAFVVEEVGGRTNSFRLLSHDNSAPKESAHNLCRLIKLDQRFS